MQSKTPKFDALLQPILDGLVPHTIKCEWEGKHEYCEGRFEITDEDIEFLRMLRVPPPNYCPTCRRMRRMVHINLLQMFKRSCNAPGHDEKIISIFPENAPFPVYDYKYYTSDEYDPFLIGRDYQRGESPINQFFELRKIAPIPSFLNRDPSSVNSEYSNGGRGNKDCYMTSGCYSTEDAYYSGMILRSSHIVDSRALEDSEYVYEALNSDHLYQSAFVYFSKNITDSYFMYDCKNCDNCFGGVNLRNRKYVVFNEQKTKEEYEEFIKNVFPLTQEKIKEYKSILEGLVESLPVNATKNIASQNVRGVKILNSKDIFDVWESHNSENVRHSDGVLSHKDSMDVFFSGGHSHNLYDVANVGSQSSDCKFSVSTKYATECEFVFNSKNVTNCFMCFGLQNKSFCILNKQYSEDDYFDIVDEMKSEMLKRGEYGDFLDLEFSPQAYNFSLSGTSFPLSNETAKELGAYIGIESESNAANVSIIDSKSLPLNIAEIGEDVFKGAFMCVKTNKPFRIVPGELAIYRRLKIPLPDIHPLQRIENLYKLSPVGLKYKAKCDSCGIAIETIYKDKKYHLYCEKCFSREVN
jgi:hypothetical protein